MRFALLAVAAAFLAVDPASANSVKVGTLELTDLWTRATPPNAPTAGGYLTITNTGDVPDRLVAVSSPQAGTGGVHEMRVDDGVMTMRPVDGGIEIPPNATVTLAPGGFHIMFIDLKAPLREGDDFPVTITFEKAGSIETFLHVKAIGAKDAGGDQGGGHAQ
ncbi:MAG TPA: copper chaperone PCu(A)C [Bauldia sp.]|nr:copper chaperone PCu(A)C [Bauldia sp.]